MEFPLWAGIEFKYDSVKPEWHVDGFEPDHPGSKTSVNATHCPFCGTSVPEIELNKKEKRKIHDSSDGNYCDSCKKRNMECQCLPPQFRWKIKR